MENVPYELIIVDNCPNKSAFEIVDIGAVASPSISYVHEPRSGISFAYNRGVEAASASMIAFIDDDEIAHPNWAANLLTAQLKFDADIVFGPVLAVLEEGSRADSAFVQKLYTIDWKQSTGLFLGTGHGGNVLLRRERCFKGGHAFNPQLGLTGGGDTLFFLELARAGASRVWCQEAIVYEIVPLRRTTYAYIFKRCIVRGQSVPRNRWMLNPPEWKAVAWFMMAGALQFVFFGLTAIVAVPISSRRAVSAASRALLGLGKLFWMYPFRINFYGPSGSA
jgi:glycosyltransferase involved in cell wall biosynthesis